MSEDTKSKAKKAYRQMLEALKWAARKPCQRESCGTVCKCGPCHARDALAYYDPTWRSR